MPLDFSEYFDYPTGNKDNISEPKKKFLSEFSLDDWKVFMKYAQAEKYFAGDVVVRSKEVDRTLYIVMKGLFNISAQTSSRKELPILQVGPGSFFGELGFLDGQPRSATVVAKTDGELLRFTYTSLESMVGNDLTLAYHFLFDLAQILAARLRTTTQGILNQGVNEKA